MWADPFCRPTDKLTAFLRSLRNLNFVRRLRLFCVLLQTTKDFRPLVTRNDGNGYETELLMLAYDTNSQILSKSGDRDYEIMKETRQNLRGKK